MIKPLVRVRRGGEWVDASHIRLGGKWVRLVDEDTLPAKLEDLVACWEEHHPDG